MDRGRSPRLINLPPPPSPPPEEIYYSSARLSRSRASSVASFLSSVNSSLRGDDHFDPEYQRSPPRRPTVDSEISYHIEEPEPTFPPLPESKVSSFGYLCDICGCKIVITRKRDWQRHVLEDLEPYVCLELVCTSSDTLFASEQALRQHYEEKHPNSKIMTVEHADCHFCDDSLPSDLARRFTHIARHLEDVAFAVLPQVTESWAFYSHRSQSSKNLPTAPWVLSPPGASSRGDFYRCPWNLRGTYNRCVGSFTELQDLAQHEDLFHDAWNQKFHCHLCNERRIFAADIDLIRHMHIVHSDAVLSSKSISDVCVFRPLNVLVCVADVLNRVRMEHFLDDLRCHTKAVASGTDVLRLAVGQIRFDIIFVDFKLLSMEASDFVRTLRSTSGVNSTTPLVSVNSPVDTDAALQHFDAALERHVDRQSLADIFRWHCSWKSPPEYPTPWESYTFYDNEPLRRRRNSWS